MTSGELTKWTGARLDLSSWNLTGKLVPWSKWAETE